MMHRRPRLLALAPMVLFVTVLLALDARGTAARVFAARAARYAVDSPEEATRLWEELGVRGRTLLLFDRFPHELAFDAAGSSRDRTSLAGFGIARNIVRRIWLVVPDREWDDFAGRAATLGAFRDASDPPDGLYLFTLSGVPLIATRASSLPSLREEALVYVNTALFDDAEVAGLLEQKNIAADVWVIRRKGASR